MNLRGRTETENKQMDFRGSKVIEFSVYYPVVFSLGKKHLKTKARSFFDNLDS